MALFTVTITGVTDPIEVYGGLAAANDYIASSFGASYTAWLALTEDDREKTLVGATRYLDRQRWQGTANAFDSTTLAFPRDGLVDRAGEVAPDAAQLALVSKATFELAVLVAGDADVLAAADQGQNIKAMGAGSARLEFFSPTKAANGTATKLPTIVHDLIGQWLAGASSGAAVIIGGTSTGTCAEPRFEDCDDFERNGGF